MVNLITILILCMMMDFMLMYFLPTAIRCGGIGDGTGALPDQDTVLAGDGLLHGIIAAGILHTGMAVTGVAIGEVTGARDGIIITRTIRRMDGEEDGIVDIQTIARHVIRIIRLPVGRTWFNQEQSAPVAQGMLSLPVQPEEWFVLMKFVRSVLQYVPELEVDHQSDVKESLQVA
jgi:hypothetical protein